MMLISAHHVTHTDDDALRKVPGIMNDAEMIGECPNLNPEIDHFFVRDCN